MYTVMDMYAVSVDYGENKLSKTDTHKAIMNYIIMTVEK